MRNTTSPSPINPKPTISTVRTLFFGADSWLEGAGVIVIDGVGASVVVRVSVGAWLVASPWAAAVDSRVVAVGGAAAGLISSLRPV